MIGFLLFLILLFAFYEGARRRTTLQVVYFGGFIISYLVAKQLYQSLGEKLELYVPYLSVSPNTKMAFYSQELSFDLDQAYYAGVAFITVMVIGWLITKLIGVLLRDLRFRNSLFEYDWVVAGVLNVMIVYTFIFLILFLLTTIPLDAIQQLFEKSGSMSLIVEKSLFLSKHFHQLWITDIIR
ncbi:CvpA family protein [Enterococcus saccharolyticus]|uniref:CvpA family protein n=1 Tax=Enterococcus saccharolyticus subsp. saccharolyticus ATCC 43076 TaxID=1139996 RepID=S0NVQ1_9ENTE|nr:CvpA family protein [Enterococcus saccharolyticus]EOT30037.1 hypothetical protein OMQ_00729 [Enterococcus saccharolyticus subsp. saccharolyticus ATCC 43076]EOT80583.1 hypothetical protein I572_01110 [Enterococcus saccharolyticus subsp. saccharolyticus ATCC 43076]OJG90122.1 hypothetical protein RV16_GL001932 [Enterococcus saccharolyticus]